MTRWLSRPAWVAAVVVVSAASSVPYVAQPRRAQQDLDEAAAQLVAHHFEDAERLLRHAAALAYDEGNLNLVLEAGRKLIDPRLSYERACHALGVLRDLPEVATAAKDCVALDTAAKLFTDVAHAAPRLPPDNPRDLKDVGEEIALELSRQSSEAAHALRLSGACGDTVIPTLDGAIVVVAATYGGNCHQSRGNQTIDLAAACNGKQTCDYVVDWKRIGDPAVGCAKDYVADWRCGGDSAVHRARIDGEAGYGTIVTLRCSQK